MDKWIISRTEELNKVVEKNLETYNTVKACAFVRKYIEDLSTWYVRNSRDRFNNGDESARETLRYVLEKIAKILAPIIPFATEKIWQDMNGKDKSVHLEDYPATNESAINEDLMIEMKVTRDIVSTSLRGRDQAQIGIKWPLAKVTVETPVIPNKELTKIILEELNIKEIEYKQTEKLNAILDTNITPELEAEGFAREISRKIQALRKKAELVKSDSIELIISSEFNDKLESQIDFIKERVGATNLSLEESTKEFENNIDGKIKGKTFEIKFNKL